MLHNISDLRSNGNNRLLVKRNPQDNGTLHSDQSTWRSKHLQLYVSISNKYLYKHVMAHLWTKHIVKSFFSIFSGDLILSVLHMFSNHIQRVLSDWCIWSHGCCYLIPYQPFNMLLTLQYTIVLWYNYSVFHFYNIRFPCLDTSITVHYTEGLSNFCFILIEKFQAL